MKESKTKDNIFVEVGVEALASCPGVSEWAIVANSTQNHRITVEAKLQIPDIQFCLVAGYLRYHKREEAQRTVTVEFAGNVCKVPLPAIKQMIIRTPK